MKDQYEAIKAVLEKYPDTRDDDMKLYAIVVHQECRLSTKVNFYEAMYHHFKYDLPSYESVTRVRRQVQKDIPELKPISSHRRKELEAEYRSFYSPT